MLVLSRQRDQTVMIGDDVEVTVVDVRGDKVRLGIRAPRSVSVHRKEVYDAIKRENLAASQMRSHDLPAPDNANPTPKPSAPTAVVSAPDAAAHLAFLRQALDEARKGQAEGGIPIGSVLVRNGDIIARGHNRRVQSGDPMAHAEIDCLKNAGRIKIYRECVLYSTLSPCYLCSGAVVQFGIPKVVVGESVTFKGDPEFLRQHGVDVIDLQNEECIELMRRFIQEHPALWSEDIGK